MKKAVKNTIHTISLAACGAGILFAGFVTLVAYNMRDIVFGTPLTIHTIADGTTVSDAFVPIAGSASHAKAVRINGRQVAIDRSGNFTDGILLSPGYNVVEVALQDKFGKEKRTTYHWVVQPTATVATTNSPYSS